MTPIAVEVCHNNRFVQEAKRVDTYANCFVKRDRPSNSIEEANEEKTRGETDENQPSTITHTVDFSKLADAGAEMEGHDV